MQRRAAAAAAGVPVPRRRIGGVYASCGKVGVDRFAREAQVRLGSISELDRAKRGAMRAHPLDVDAENTSGFLARQQTPRRWALSIAQSLDHLPGDQLGVTWVMRSARRHLGHAHVPRLSTGVALKARMV